MNPIMISLTPSAMLMGLLLAVGFVETAAAQIWTAGHKLDVHCLAFSPGGKLLATGSLHNGRTEKHPGDDNLRKLIQKQGGDAKQVEFVLKRGGEIKLWNVATGEAVRTVWGHTDCVASLAFSPDGKTLATANKILIGIRERDRSCEVKLWDVATGKARATLTGHSNSIWSLAFSPDGKTLASADLNGTVIIWEMATAKELLSFEVPNSRLRSLAYLPDGKILATGTSNGSITFWSTRTGKKRGDIQGKPGFRGCYCLSVSPDGTMLAAGLLPSAQEPLDGIVQVWEIATIGKSEPLISTIEKSTFARHRQLVGALSFSPDERVLASGSSDTTVRLCSPLTGKQLAVLKAHTGNARGVAFSPDGRYLATASWDHSVKLWSLAEILNQ